MHRRLLTIVTGAWKGRFGLATRSISETRRLRYLLGKSSPAEREHIESEYFEDEDAFQEMLTAEDDLIDAYARGELTDEERQGFEKSLVSLFRKRDRVQFARAFAGAVSATRSVETKLPGTWLDNFKTFQAPGLLRVATIAAVIVFVAVLAWLVSDRRRMTNELRELRAESAELSKRTEALQRNSETERTRTAEIAAQLADLQAQPEKPRPPKRGTIATKRARHLPEAKNDREKFAMIIAKPEERLVNQSDASLANAFERKNITELPLNPSNVPTLLTLQPATTPSGSVEGNSADQAKITLDGVPVEPLHTYSLPPNTSSSAEPTIRIPSSLSWIRFQIALETAANHENYRVTIKTADGRPITSVDWIEPLTPNQIIIDTPVVSTDDLPSGDYVLLLMGKEPDHSFVKVVEYSFKVIKY